ncbi:18253_t:CDS:2 [Rhizophagus irregularis]|nr:18253_t:CDS:2 [Rhizophagus irregularis]
MHENPPKYNVEGAMMIGNIKKRFNPCITIDWGEILYHDHKRRVTHELIQKLADNDDDGSILVDECHERELKVCKFYSNIEMKES